MSAFFSAIIHDYGELADALAELKNFRGLSNEALEELAGLSRGHIDKALGPSRAKGLGKNSLPWILKALAGRLVLELDPEQEQLMRSRWEGRNDKQIRTYAHVVSKTILRRAAPVIFRQLTRNATLARLTKLSPKQRSRIARHAAVMRWKRRSKDHGQIAERNSARASGTSKPDAAGTNGTHRSAGLRAVAAPPAPAARDRAVSAAHHNQAGDRSRGGRI